MQKNVMKIATLELWFKLIMILNIVKYQTTDKLLQILSFRVTFLWSRCRGQSKRDLILLTIRLFVLFYGVDDSTWTGVYSSQLSEANTLSDAVKISPDDVIERKVKECLQVLHHIRATWRFVPKFGDPSRSCWVCFSPKPKVVDGPTF